MQQTLLGLFQERLNCQVLRDPLPFHGAVTNMLAVCFAKRDKKGVNEVLSDSLSIALVMGVVLAVACYAISPWLLARIAGPASADVVAPALSYVRIR